MVVHACSYATNAARVANRTDLMPTLQRALSRHSSRHWIDTFEAVNVPCGPVCNMEQVFEHPQVIARGMRLDLPHPTCARRSRPLYTPLHLSPLGPAPWTCRLYLPLVPAA